MVHLWFLGIGILFLLGFFFVHRVYRRGGGAVGMLVIKVWRRS